MGTSSSTKKIEKALNDYPEMSKEERKALIVSLKSSADRGCVRKEVWIDMVKEKGVPLGLAEALWNTFDRKREGQLDLEFFLPLLARSLCGTEEDKLNVSFDLFDVECKEMITLQGVSAILEYCYEYDQYKRGETISDTDREQINVMTSLVFKLTEKQEEEAINRQEFIDALRKNEELMKVMKKF